MTTARHALRITAGAFLIAVCFLVGGVLATPQGDRDTEPPCVQVAADDGRGLPECGTSL